MMKADKNKFYEGFKFKASNAEEAADLGVSLLEEGRREEGIELLRFSVDHGSSFGTARLGHTLFFNSDDEDSKKEGLTYLERAAQSEKIEDLYFYGLALKKLDRTDEARKHLENCVCANFPPGFYILAQIHNDTGNLEKMRDLVKRGSDAGHIPSKLWMNRMSFTGTFGLFGFLNALIFFTPNLIMAIYYAIFHRGSEKFYI